MTTDTTAGAFNPPAASDGRATADHALYRKLRQKLSRVHPANQAPDCPLQIRLTYGEISRLSTALLYSAPPASGADLTDRFWLIVREPGRVPDRKGPWKHSETAKVLREFMAANPTAFIDHLTIGDDGTPDVEHGPLVLQYTDGRSMAVGRKHNERTRAAAKAALAAPDDITCAGAEDAVTAIAKAVCWHHFGLKWEHAEKASHEDLRAMVTRMLHAGVSPARPEPVDKKTMTISLSEREQEALERLMAEQALSAPQIFKCALREYQMGHERRKAGETVVWSGDEQRARDFAGPLARPEPVVDGAAVVRRQAIEECALVAQTRAMLIPSVSPEAAIACLEALPDAIRALPDAGQPDTGEPPANCSTDSAVLSCLSGFVADLTNGGRNRDTLLSFDHDKLRARIKEAKALLPAEAR